MLVTLYNLQDINMNGFSHSFLANFYQSFTFSTTPLLFLTLYPLTSFLFYKTSLNHVLPSLSLTSQHITRWSSVSLRCKKWLVCFRITSETEIYGFEVGQNVWNEWAGWNEVGGMDWTKCCGMAGMGRLSGWNGYP